MKLLMLGMVAVKRINQMLVNLIMLGVLLTDKMDCSRMMFVKNAESVKKKLSMCWVLLEGSARKGHILRHLKNVATLLRNFKSKVLVNGKPSIRIWFTVAP